MVPKQTFLFKKNRPLYKEKICEICLVYHVHTAFIKYFIGSLGLVEINMLLQTYTLYRMYIVLKFNKN